MDVQCNIYKIHLLLIIINFLCILVTYNQKIKCTGMLKNKILKEGDRGGGGGLVLTSVSHPKLNKIPPFKSMKSHHPSASLLKFQSHFNFVFFNCQ